MLLQSPKDISCTVCAVGASLGHPSELLYLLATVDFTASPYTQPSGEGSTGIMTLVRLTSGVDSIQFSAIQNDTCCY